MKSDHQVPHIKTFGKTRRRFSCVSFCACAHMHAAARARPFRTFMCVPACVFELSPSATHHYVGLICPNILMCGTWCYHTCAHGYMCSNVPNLSSLAWSEVYQEPPVLEVHTWRMLKVPDWGLGGWGHPWSYESSLDVILDLCAKF